MTISNKPTNDIDHGIDGTAMTRMFNLWNIFELVNDRLNDWAFASEKLISQAHQAIFHIALWFGKELNAATGESFFYEFSHLNTDCFQIFLDLVLAQFADSVILM